MFHGPRGITDAEGRSAPSRQDVRPPSWAGSGVASAPEIGGTVSRADEDVADGEAVGLLALAEDMLEGMSDGRSGRAARTLRGGQALRQVLLVLRAGTRLDDHRAPGPSTLVVLRGAVDLMWGEEARRLEAGDWARIPEAVHAVAAHDDAALLLTVPGR